MGICASCAHVHLCSCEFESRQRYAWIDETIACDWPGGCSRNDLSVLGSRREGKLGEHNRRRESCLMGAAKEVIGMWENKAGMVVVKAWNLSHLGHGVRCGQ